MPGELRIRPLEPGDVGPIVAAFAAAAWPRSAGLYERYLADQEAGARVVRVALLDGAVCGYVTVAWTSDHAPFREAGIPEIKDLNVLPAFRRRGIASRLMDEAERIIAERSPVAGIGVGLYGDYGPAQRMYVLRGYVPEGRGIVHRDHPVRGGETVRADDDLVLHLTKMLA
jgi:ribosomal protein S18 acetylase RimI-like enzyme